MKVTSRIAEELKRLTEHTTLSQTEVIKSVIYQIQMDVVDAHKPALMRELGALSVISA